MAFSHPKLTLGYWKIIPFLLTILVFSACQPDAIDTPRLATLTAESQLPATPANTPIKIIAPTPTAGIQELESSNESINGSSESNQTITIWINETSDEHSRVLKGIAEDFNNSFGIHVEMVLVSDQLLPELVQTAVISNTLPDLILHPFEYSLGWAEKGILDSAAASQVVNELGEETFSEKAIEILSSGNENGQIAALPSDGYRQIIVYRQDWFEELGLNTPETYDTILAGAEAIFQPEDIVSGIIIPTDSALVTTQQAFEHIAKANGCELVDDKGEITLLHPACLDALEYYRLLINEYSPIGLQTDTSALNAYLSGRTGIIMASPSILPAIAGLDEVSKPNCPACLTSDFLVQNSGILTSIKGSSEFATEKDFYQINALGITSVADPTAIEFAKFWFNEGYPDWLSVNPERKVPMRLGTNNQPRQYIDDWKIYPLSPGGPSLTDVYDAELVLKLSDEFVPSNRWGFSFGQGSLITTLYEDLTLSSLLQEMLSGYFTSSQTVIEMYQAVVDLVPNYPFPIEIAPTPTP